MSVQSHILVSPYVAPAGTSRSSLLHRGHVCTIDCFHDASNSILALPFLHFDLRAPPVRQHGMSRRAVPKMDRAKGASRAAATKKQGAGGKGTWGRPGDEVGWVEKLDPNDPNYDSEEESGVLYETDVGEIVRSYGEDKKVDYAPASRRTQKPPDITLAQFKTKIITVLLEYFVSDDTDEVARCVPQAKQPSVTCPVHAP